MIDVTREFKAKFKAADTIIVGIKDNIILFTCIREAHRKMGWDTPETRREFTYTNENYTKMDNAWFHIPYAKDSTIHALYYLLKIGDQLRFSTLDNSCEYLTKNKLHHDELIVSVYRKGNCIIPRMVITSSVCEDNSARSIQRRT